MKEINSKSVEECSLKNESPEELDKLIDEIVAHYNYEEVLSSIQRVLKKRGGEALTKRMFKLAELIQRFGPKL